MAILTGNFMVFFSHFGEIPGNNFNLVKATKFTIHKSSHHSTLYLYNYINYIQYVCAIESIFCSGKMTLDPHSQKTVNLIFSKNCLQIFLLTD